MKNNIIINKKPEYQWNQNWADPVAHTDINKVVSELKEIEEVRGDITPTLIVESAKNKKSVLHKYFEWDDTTAANKFRISQASTLLRHIEVKVIQNGEPYFVRVYETLSRNNYDSSNKYKRFDSLSEINVAQIVKLCISDLNRVKNKLSALGFAESSKHIDKAIEELSKDDTKTKEELNKIVNKEKLSVAS
jgi:hypothetical protein